MNNTDTALAGLVSDGDSVADMLSGLRDNVDASEPADNAETEWPSEPTEVDVEQETASAEVPAADAEPDTSASDVETPEAGANKAPEESAESPPESPDAQDDLDAQLKEADAPAAQPETDAQPESQEQPEAVVVDLEKVEAEYQTSGDRIKESLERKYSGEAKRIHDARQSLDERYRAATESINAQLKAIRDGAVDDDMGAKVERPYLPSEEHRRDELKDKLEEIRENYRDQVRQIEVQSKQVLDAYSRDEALGKLDAWTNYIVGCDPRLAPMKDVVRNMAMAGEIRANADGRIDSEELFLRAQYRSGQKGAATQRVVTSNDVEKAKAVQTENKMQAAVRERGLGTIAAGKGGSASGAGKTGKPGTADYAKGASPECVAGLETLDAYLNGEL